MLARVEKGKTSFLVAVYRLEQGFVQWRIPICTYIVILEAEHGFIAAQNQHNADCCVLERSRFVGGNLMVWSG